MKKRAKTKRFLLLIVMIFTMVTLTGCGHEEKSDAEVIHKYNEKEIKLYSDKPCNVQISVNVKENDEIQSVIKSVPLGDSSTTIISVTNLATDFFTEEAEIDSVEIISVTETVYAWWEWVIFIFVVLCILSAIFRW